MIKIKTTNQNILHFENKLIIETKSLILKPHIKDNFFCGMYCTSDT